MASDENDQRLTNQENYLKGAVLSLRRYRRPRPDWDHDHCEFCWATFMEECAPQILQEGYTTQDEYRWICPRCFEDFKERFAWVVASDLPSTDRDDGGGG